MRTTRSLRVSDEAWAELRRRAHAAGVGGRGEYLEWLVAASEPERPVVRSFEGAWKLLDADEQKSLKWSQLALRAFYNAVVGND